jgi:hypothetical protein
MRVYAFALIAIVACDAASSSHPTDDTPDPTGTWRVAATWGKGTCGATYAWDAQYRVTSEGASYTVFDVLYNAPPSEATVVCSPDGCELAVTQTWPADGDGSLTMILALALKTSGEVVGAGEASVTGTTTCHQSFTAFGSVSP